MKINVEYDEFYAKYGIGNFVFIKDEDGVIRNLEARW